MTRRRDFHGLSEGRVVALRAFANAPDRHCRALGVPMDDAVRRVHQDVREVLAGYVEIFEMTRGLRRRGVRSAGRPASHGCDTQPTYMRLTSRQYCDMVESSGRFELTASRERSRRLRWLERQGWVAVGYWHEPPGEKEWTEAGWVFFLDDKQFEFAREWKNLQASQSSLTQEQQDKRWRRFKARAKAEWGQLTRVGAAPPRPARYFWHTWVRWRLDPEHWNALPPVAKEGLEPVGKQLRASAGWPWGVCDIPGCNRFLLRLANTRACAEHRRQLSPHQRHTRRQGVSVDKNPFPKPRRDLTDFLAAAGVPLITGKMDQEMGIAAAERTRRAGEPRISLSIPTPSAECDYVRQVCPRCGRSAEGWSYPLLPWLMTCYCNCYPVRDAVGERTLMFRLRRALAYGTILASLPSGGKQTPPSA